MPAALINFTPWLPDLTDKPTSDPAFWDHWLVNDAADCLMRACVRIERPITAISLRGEGNRTDILARPDGHREAQPMLSICDGLTFRDLQAAHQTLITTERKAAA